jgi:hypothetical protein
MRNIKPGLTSIMAILSPTDVGPKERAIPRPFLSLPDPFNIPLKVVTLDLRLEKATGFIAREAP